MAKNSPARRRDIAAKGAFDDGAYDNVVLSATFEQNELTLNRAAEQLAPRLKSSFTFVNLASLLVLVAAAVLFGDLTAVLIVLFLIAIALLYVSSHPNRLAVRYARGTNLSPSAYEGSVHVVVCDDAVHVEDEGGSHETFPFSELRSVRSTPDCVVAGFGRRRYVFVPRSALSEGRFRELIRVLEGHLH